MPSRHVKNKTTMDKLRADLAIPMELSAEQTKSFRQHRLYIGNKNPVKIDRLTSLYKTMNEHFHIKCPEVAALTVAAIDNLSGSILHKLGARPSWFKDVLKAPELYTNNLFKSVVLRGIYPVLEAVQADTSTPLFDKIWNCVQHHDPGQSHPPPINSHALEPLLRRCYMYTHGEPIKSIKFRLNHELGKASIPEGCNSSKDFADKFYEWHSASANKFVTFTAAVISFHETLKWGKRTDMRNFACYKDKASSSQPLSASEASSSKTLAGKDGNNSDASDAGSDSSVNFDVVVQTRTFEVNSRPVELSGINYSMSTPAEESVEFKRRRLSKANCEGTFYAMSEKEGTHQHVPAFTFGGANMVRSPTIGRFNSADSDSTLSDPGMAAQNGNSTYCDAAKAVSTSEGGSSISKPSVEESMKNDSSSDESDDNSDCSVDGEFISASLNPKRTSRTFAQGMHNPRSPSGSPGPSPRAGRSPKPAHVTPGRGRQPNRRNTDPAFTSQDPCSVTAFAQANEGATANPVVLNDSHMQGVDQARGLVMNQHEMEQWSRRHGFNSCSGKDTADGKVRGTHGSAGSGSQHFSQASYDGWVKDQKDEFLESCAANRHHALNDTEIQISKLMTTESNLADGIHDLALSQMRDQAMVDTNVDDLSHRQKTKLLKAFKPRMDFKDFMITVILCPLTTTNL